MYKFTSKLSVLMLLLAVFFSYNIKQTNALELDEKTNIDLLIENKQEKETLQLRISELKKEIDYKLTYIDDIENDNNKNNDIEVVSISFIQGNKVTKNDEVGLLEQEIAKLQNEKYKIEKDLENLMIESVQVEKIIEEEKKVFLEENNIQFIKGIWPLENYFDISSAFGERIHPISNVLKFHRGIDIPAPQDTDILSSDDGIVIFSGYQSGYGNVVKIKHFDGKRTVYAHNNSNIAKEGDIVRKGQAIAKVGTTGNSTGNHVHFEVIVNEENINPNTAVDKKD